MVPDQFMSLRTRRGRVIPISNAGFTLVEILIVVAIIGLLAAVAIPSFARARGSAQKSGCINNLRQIDGAKQQWAFETKASDDTRPTQDDLTPFLRDNQFPHCPAAGNYRIRRVSRLPVCDLTGHSLIDPDGLPD